MLQLTAVDGHSNGWRRWNRRSRHGWGRGRRRRREPTVAPLNVEVEGTAQYVACRGLVARARQLALAIARSKLKRDARRYGVAPRGASRKSISYVIDAELVGAGASPRRDHVVVGRHKRRRRGRRTRRWRWPQRVPRWRWRWRRGCRRRHRAKARKVPWRLGTGHRWGWRERRPGWRQWRQRARWMVARFGA